MDLALASFHKYSQRKSKMRLSGALYWALLWTFFKTGISLWVIKIEVCISVNTHSLCWNGSQTSKHYSSN
ncbi:mCG1027077 [Mus musculus]|nr:mCG1027077 [Mus musculus]